GPVERCPQRGGVPDVALAVLHLRPATLRRVERPPRDPDDALDPLVGLEQRHQREPEGAGGSGHRHGQAGLVRRRRHAAGCTRNFDAVARYRHRTSRSAWRATWSITTYWSSVAATPGSRWRRSCSA